MSYCFSSGVCTGNTSPTGTPWLRLIGVFITNAHNSWRGNKPPGTAQLFVAGGAVGAAGWSQ